MDRTTEHYRIFETAGGWCGIAWHDAGITGFRLPMRAADAAERLLRQRHPGARPGTPTAAVDATIAAVTRYYAGEPTDFSDVALDLGGQTALFAGIYAALRRVGWGHTTTYGALAKEVGGGPEVARDVGEAMARNPVPLIIPCHRVLAAGSKLGGFSAPGGAVTKRRMLELEGVALEPPPPAQQAFGF